jgi:hypothetical protein
LSFSLKTAKRSAADPGFIAFSVAYRSPFAFFVKPLTLPEVFLLGPTFGTNPVLGKILESGPRFDTVVQIALSRVVYITTGTFILSHIDLLMRKD